MTYACNVACIKDAFASQDDLPRMSLSPSHRNTIDQEVYKWVVQQTKKKKLVTPNGIRQKAYEIGQEYDPNFKASLNWYNNWKKRYEYNESPEAEALKHKKRSYTAAFKLHAVQRAMELESASQASLELDVSRRCLQRWKEELDVISTVAEQSSNAVYRRPGQGRKVANADLDNQLVEWVKDSWRQGITVSSSMVRDKAKELSSRSDFKASLGWFVKWQKRHGVDLKQQTCSAPYIEPATPLKLRLLPEGEGSAYSTPRRRKYIRKRRHTNDDEILLENDEEFDRLLLTWLVERWEAGDIVNDRMLKEKAMELTANPDFKASKAWLMAWKRKYNVSLENQTYGTEGDDENEEIIEETEVYDNEVVLDHQQAHVNPLTPTKEEAATALASLSADDHEPTGLEIAEALQKLASAFGLTTGLESTKDTMAQLTAAYQGDTSEFILDQSSQVAVEEVVSEEVVTDEPMVVIETTVDHPQQVHPSLLVTSHGSSLTSMASHSSHGHSSTVTTLTASPGSYITEEVVISDSGLEASGVPIDAQVEVMTQGEEAIEVYPSTDATSVDTIIDGSVASQSSVGSYRDLGDCSSLPMGRRRSNHDSTFQSARTRSIPISQRLQNSCNSPQHIKSHHSLQPSSSSSIDLMNTVATIVSNLSSSAGVQLHGADISSDTITVCAQDLSLITQDILDIGSETVASSDESPSKRTYNEDFKARVVSRAQELGSVQQAAREFSVPWRAVATWHTKEKQSESQ